jgi:cytochrome P450
VLEDPDTFSSFLTGIPASGWPRRLIPVELDPPDHGRYRATIVRCLAGSTSRAITAAVQQECARLVEVIAPRHECDLVAEYTRPIQNAVFRALFDVQGAEVEACAQWIADVLQHGDVTRRSRAVQHLTDYVGRRAAELRTEEPNRNDNPGMLYRLSRATVGGAPLPDDAIRDIGFVMAMASLDTLSNSLSFGFRFLAEHPQLQHRLAAELIAPAAVVDELLRLHSVVSTARVARRDTTLAGSRIRQGDRVLLCLSLADRDPDTYVDPLEANFDRKNAPGHLAFGAGSHRCLGSGIAIQAFVAAVREWHRRIPSYTMSSDAHEQTTSGGAVSSLSCLPLVWAGPTR